MAELLAPNARATVHDLSERAPTAWERHLWRTVRAGVVLGPDPVLASWLDIADTSLHDSGVPEQMAEACFGDPTLVYDCTARLLREDITDARIALLGPPPGFESSPGENLAGFIAAKQRGVIVLDDLQAFDEWVIEVLAGIADSGLACPEGSASPTLSAEHFVIMARARMPVPSPRAMASLAGLEGGWDAGGDAPGPFAEALEAHARSLHPQHFRHWVAGRFEGVRPVAAWSVASQLMVEGQYERAIFEAPKDVRMPPVLRGLPASPQNLAPNVTAIPALPTSPGQFDVFISYSWSRTGDRAAWLRDQLTKRGFRVFLDKDQLATAGTPSAELKQFLIQRLIQAVESSSVCIIFAAQLRTYRPTVGFTDEEAIKQGLAIRHVDGSIVEWSWQTLELRHASSHLVIDSGTVYRVANGRTDDSFPQRNVREEGDLLSAVLEYLEREGIRPQSRP